MTTIFKKFKSVSALLVVSSIVYSSAYAGVGGGVKSNPVINRESLSLLSGLEVYLKEKYQEQSSQVSYLVDKENKRFVIYLNNKPLETLSFEQANALAKSEI